MASIEIERMPDPERRRKVSALLPPRRRIIRLTDELLDAAHRLTKTGFGLAEAVHLCAASQLAVDVFLTVDDKLVKRAKRFAQAIKVRVIDQANFLKRVER
jgi:predicted nucleic acid-binding protein